MIESNGCGSLQITLCGKVREMVIDRQYKTMKEKKFKPNMAQVVEGLLKEVAEKK